MSGHGFHWTPCPGRGGIPAGLVVLVVLVAAAYGGPVVSAAVELVEIMAVTAGVLLVVGAGAAVTVWRARRRRARGVRSARPLLVTAVREPAVLDGRQAPAGIEPPRGRVSAYPRTDAGAHVVTGRAPRPRCPYRSSCHHNASEALPARRRRGEGSRDG